MTELLRPYGAPNHTSADPVLEWLNEFWGRPVRVRVIEMRDEHWLHGVVTSVGIAAECLFTRQTIVEIRVRDEHDQEISVWIDTTAGGQLIWDSPLRRILRIIDNAGRTYVIYDNRPICQGDTLERQLAMALNEKDPVRRYEALAELGAMVTRGAEEEPDDALRARAVALSVFLEEYGAQPPQ